MKRSFSLLALHPFLFAFYPILFLLVENQFDLRLYSVVRPVALALLMAGVLLVLFRLLFKNWQRAALAASIVIILFFSYGHVRSFIQDAVVLSLPIGRQRYFILLWAVIAATGLFGVGWKLKDPSSLNQILTLVAVVLIGLSVYQGVAAQAHQNSIARMETQDRLKQLGITTITKGLKPPANLPDIYYIILDGYSRADILNQLYGFDNSAFLQQLKKRGFYVADCSTANYNKTVYSVASTLNMQYIDPFGKPLLGNDINWEEFAEYLRQSTVRHTLQELGYKTAAVQTMFYWANLHDVDVFYTPNAHQVTWQDINPAGVTNFEGMLIQTTLLDGLTPLHNLLFGVPAEPENGQKGEPAELDEVTLLSNTNALQYSTEQYIFDHLDDLVAFPGPKFSYVHLVSTHPPFIHGADGTFQELGNTDAGYTASITYTNQRVLAVVDDILKSAKTPPIIVIQADHGRRMGAGNPARPFEHAILNAYYLPDGGEKLLYPSISPVNTFRVIFNRYFGAQLPLLEDKRYDVVATPNTPQYHFEPSADPQQACKEGVQ